MIFERILGIAACDPRGIMGKEGKLPWHCPEELKHFSDTIFHHPLIMGHRTFLSLPAHYFEQRATFVFTHQKNRNSCFVSSLEQLFALKGSFKDLYVIGGAQIYNLFLKEHLIDEFILTKLKDVYEGDLFFPLPLLNGWSNFKEQETSIFSIHRYLNPLRRR